MFASVFQWMRQGLIGALAASVLAFAAGMLAPPVFAQGAAPATTFPPRGEVIFAVNEGVTYRITPHETRQRYAELADLIGRTLKRRVRVEPVENYKTLRAGLEERRYDIAYVHPAHHALRAVRDQGYQVVVVTRGCTSTAKVSDETPQRVVRPMWSASPGMTSS